MLQNISFLICLCDKTYKKPCFSAEKCYIIWLNRAFACIFAAVKNKKAIFAKRSLSEGEALVYFLKIRSRRKRQLKDAPIKFNIKMMI